MASWVVQLSSEVNNYVTNVDLKDTVGPFNEWFAQKSGAFSQASGTFTNQTQHVVDVAGDWVLNNIDIDSVKVGKKGDGECKTDVGDFPLGELSWEIIRKL